MKRHPALQDLSRDHHTALIHAQRLRRARMESEGRSLAQSFLDCFRTLLEPHFQDEEALLVPHLEEPHAKRLRAEHDAVRAQAAAARLHLGEGRALIPLVRQLGARLDEHVRFEEMVCFESLQRRLEPNALVAIGAAETARRQGRDESCALLPPPRIQEDL